MKFEWKIEVPKLHCSFSDASVAIVLPPGADETLESILLDIVSKQSDSTLDQTQTNELQIDFSERLSKHITKGTSSFSILLFNILFGLGHFRNR